jgi:exocyst complex component 3
MMSNNSSILYIPLGSLCGPFLDAADMQVSTIHRNFAQTAKMVQNLRSMSDRVDHLADLLAQDKNQAGGPVGPSPNLLPIHFQLQQLEAFRNETMHQAKKSDAAEREVLTKWFANLDKVGVDFEAWMWEISRNVVELARRGHGGTVVRLLKIIEVEGKEDEKVSTDASPTVAQSLTGRPSPCDWFAK